MAERLEIIITAKDNASKVIKGIGDVSKGAFKVSMGIAAGGLVGLAGAMGYLVKGEMEMEAEMAELNAVIESTGGIAGWTAKEAEDLALAFQKTTRFADDQVISAQSMLLTFTQIGEDVFPQATEATLNLAEKFGSIDQASTMLGKALNDPIQGVTALRRVGIQLTEQQEEQIQSFMDVGDIAGAQKVILGELETQFGGLAEAMGDTTQGKITRFKHLLENAAGSIVALVMPAFGKLLDKLLGIIPTVDRFALVFGNFLQDMFAGPDLIYEASEALGFFLGNTDKANKIAFKLISTFWGVVDAVKGIVGVVVEFVKDHGPAFRNALLAIGAILAGAAVLGGILSLAAAIAAIANPITAIIGAIALLAMAWTEDWLGIRTAVTEAWNKYIQPVIGELKKWLEENIPKAIDYLKARWEDTFKPALQDVADFVVETVIPAFLDIVNWLQSLIPGAIAVAKAAWNGVFKPAIEGIVDFVIGTVLPALGDLLDWLEVSVPSGVNMAKSAWENQLKPALEVVYTFVKETLMPVLGNLAWWLTSTIGLAVDAAVDAWNNVLKPAFDLVYGFVKDDLLPTLGNLAWWFLTVIGAAIDVAKPFLEGVRDIFDLIKGAVEAIPDVIDRFTSALGKITVPQPIIDLYNFLKDIVGYLGEVAASETVIHPQTGKPVTPQYNALGGPVTAGLPYIVGERGPELFMPNANGRIIPNHRLGGAGGNTFNLTVYSNASSENIIRDFGVMRAWVGS